MKRWLRVVTMAAGVAFPAAVCAQPAGGPPPGGGPPPAVRARMREALREADAAARQALTTGHRDAVARIGNAVAARRVDPRTGARQIDALLSAGEKTRLIAMEQKMRARLRPLGPPPMGPPVFGEGGAPPGGPPPGPLGPPSASAREPDPGHFLLMLSRSRRFFGPEPRSTGAQ